MVELTNGHPTKVHRDPADREISVHDTRWTFDSQKLGGFCNGKLGQWNLVLQAVVECLVAKIIPTHLPRRSIAVVRVHGARTAYRPRFRSG